MTTSSQTASSSSSPWNRTGSMPHPAGPSIANLSQTSSSTHGGDASWYDTMLSHLSHPPSWPPDKENAILEPYSYLDANPGKEVRSQLIEAFNVWLQVPLDKLIVIRSVVRMLHTASLLMDDVEDNSDLRRGIPVAHKIYGIPQTINTANYVYFLVFDQIFRMTNTAAVEPEASRAGKTTAAARTASMASVERLVVDELINLHRGQGMDLLWRDSLICPTEEEYVEMVNNKTGGLFRIAIKLMISQSPIFCPHLGAAPSPSQPSSTSDSDGTRPAAMQTALPDLLPLVNLIGLLFQIRDDYMNLQSSTYAENKGFCEDLTEGKFSFPIIHSIRASAGVNAAGGEVHSSGARPSDAATERQGEGLGNAPHVRVEGGPAVGKRDSAAADGCTTPPIRPTSTHASSSIITNPSASASFTSTKTPQHPSSATSTLAQPSAQGNRQILNVLKQRPTDLATKQYAVAYMRNVTRSFEYTREVLTKLERQARAEVARIEGETGQRNPLLVRILDALRGGWFEDV